MRSYEELEANAYKKAEQIINESKRKKKIMLRRSFGLTLGAAAVIGIGICANAFKPPEKPTADSSAIIAETTSAEAPTAAETTSKASVQVEKTGSEPVRSTETTAETSSTETAAQTSTKTASTAPAAENTEQPTAAEHTTLRTTTKAPVATTSAKAVSSKPTEPKTTSARTTTAATTEKTTRTETTTAAPKYDIPPIDDLPSQVIPDEALLPSMNELELLNGVTYSNCFQCISEEKIGSFLEELIIEKQPNPYISPIQTTVKLYEIKYSSTDYRLAVKFKGSQVYHIYENPVYAQ